MADIKIADLERSDELDTAALKEVCGGRSGISNLRHGVQRSVLAASAEHLSSHVSAPAHALEILSPPVLDR